MLIGFGISPSRVKASAGVSYDADASAFFTAASITDSTQKSAVNQLVLDLKSYNIWTKMKALYPIVGGTASTHKWNLKDPRDLDAAYRLNFTTGWTHNSNGMNGDGVSAYTDTFLIPRTNLTNLNSHLSYYLRTNSLPATAFVDSGNQDDIGGAGCEYLLTTRNSSNLTYPHIQPNGSTNFADSDSRGFMIASRTAINSLKGYKNGVLKVTNTNNATAQLPNIKLLIGCFNYRNSGGTITQLYHSSRQMAFLSMGDGLTDTEAANFYTAVQAYQTTLSRNV